jgi:hypothetical protein
MLKAGGNVFACERPLRTALAALERALTQPFTTEGAPSEGLRTPPEGPPRGGATVVRENMALTAAPGPPSGGGEQSGEQSVANLVPTPRPTAGRLASADLVIVFFVAVALALSSLGFWWSVGG